MEYPHQNKTLSFKALQTECRISTVLKAHPVYKCVSTEEDERENSLKPKQGIQVLLTSSLSDPIVKLLAKNSHLTSTQLETLLIDILSENAAGKQLKYDEKAKLRLTKAGISRGAFNRTLRQSKENVIKSIYTVLLLGYLGVFETTTLDPYLEVANKLKEYLEAYKNIPNQTTDPTEHLKVIEIIREELETSLKQLSNPSGESS
jgi:hypothetical protein